MVLPVVDLPQACLHFGIQIRLLHGSFQFQNYRDRAFADGFEHEIDPAVPGLPLGTDPVTSKNTVHQSEQNELVGLLILQEIVAPIDQDALERLRHGIRITIQKCGVEPGEKLAG